MGLYGLHLAVENERFLLGLFCVAAQLFLDPSQSAFMQGRTLDQPTERCPFESVVLKRNGAAIWASADDFCSSGGGGGGDGQAELSVAEELGRGGQRFVGLWGEEVGGGYRR